MKLRALTALVLIPPVVYLIVWSPLWLFLAALLLVVERTAHEYFGLSEAAGFGGFRWLGYAGCGLLCLAQVGDLHADVPAALAPGTTVLMLAVLLVPASLTLALLGAGELRKYLAAACSTVFGIFYVGLMLSWLVPLRSSPAIAQAAAGAISPRYLLLFMFAVIWAGDIFAYLVGRGIGRRLLFPRISPKKTLEGSLGGLAGSLLVAWVMARWWWKTPDLKTAMLLAGIVAVAGQVGDLVESALKRSADVKDSASLLPGHGGLLDRIDSLIFGAPALWLALALMHAWRS
ncbi:MAG TPA: phosphatidate cytidylyltransferase [Terriglobia bacterium]|nr:phosphatidate cytidylyltransferase [Terriglobia bacterium]